MSSLLKVLHRKCEEEERRLHLRRQSLYQPAALHARRWQRRRARGERPTHLALGPHMLRQLVGAWAPTCPQRRPCARGQELLQAPGLRSAEAPSRETVPELQGLAASEGVCGQPRRRAPCGSSPYDGRACSRRRRRSRSPPLHRGGGTCDPSRKRPSPQRGVRLAGWQQRP